MAPRVHGTVGVDPLLSFANRVVSASDFKAAVRAGTRRADEHFVAYLRPTTPDAEGRFGFIVTRAVGGAVVRNRVRRRLRAASAELLSTTRVHGVDVVIRALPGSAELSWNSLQAELGRVVERGARK